MENKMMHFMDEKSTEVYIQTAREEEKFKTPLFNMTTETVLLKSEIKDGVILDVGCGPGQITRRLGKANPKFNVIGVDLSANMIEGAKILAAEENVQNVEFRIGNVENLPFEDDTFDLVVTQGSLLCWENPVKGIKELYRVAKKGSYIYIRDLRRDCPQEAIDHITGFMNHPKRIEGFKKAIEDAYTMDEFEDLIKKSDISKYEMSFGFPEEVRFKFIPNYQKGQSLSDVGMQAFILKA
jgi:ubiquinone/menaquinone biosynthesis C-methylase UbiE